MNKYETVIIINDTLTQEKKDATIKKIVDYINENGNVTSQEIVGSKRLAYEIRKQKTGYYIIIKFDAESNFVAELERLYRITAEVIKFIVVREDD